MLKPLLFLFSLIPFASTACKGYYAVDFTDRATLDQLNCLKTQNYEKIMPRVSLSNGEVDLNGIQTIKTMQDGMKNSLFVVGVLTPQVNSTDGLVQVYKLMQAVIGYNIKDLQNIAIQVTRDSASWPTNPSSNVALINSLISYLKSDYNVQILTTYWDWQVITGNYQNITGYVPLWYSSVFGAGVTGESPPNYNDFVAFGAWTKDLVVTKQFAVGENLCGLSVNRDVKYVC